MYTAMLWTRCIRMSIVIMIVMMVMTLFALFRIVAHLGITVATGTHLLKLELGERVAWSRKAL